MEVAEYDVNDQWCVLVRVWGLSSNKPKIVGLSKIILIRGVAQI
jgi:hypothetical protein